MLDDLKFIHQRDAQDALGIAEKQCQQLEHNFDLKDEGLKFNDIKNIVYAGMGGSALAAVLSNTWPGYTVPFEVSRQYHIPAHVSPNTLFVASSYSGNTEETLSALAEAEGKGAQIVVIAGGGKLQEIAGQKNYPFLLLPDTGQPRYAVMANLKALVLILEKADFVQDTQASSQIHEAGNFLKQSIGSWLPTVPVVQNPAKKLAHELVGKTPIVYAGPLLAPAAYKWKISFNENSKNAAWWNVVPEMNHNELMGWSYPIQKPFAVIELRSNLEHPQVQKRFEVAERLLSGLRPAPNIVEIQGKTALEQLLWAVNFGDFVSIYLALLNNVNPTPVELNDKFKKALTE